MAAKGLIGAVIVAVAAAWALGLGAAVPATAALSTSGVLPTDAAPAADVTPSGRQSIDFVEDDDPDLRNPERGLFIGTYSLLDIAAGDAFLRQASAVGTVAHLNVDLSAFYDAHPEDDVVVDTTIPADVLVQYAMGFQRFREAGMKAIVRFSYSPSGTTVCGEGVNPGDGGPRSDGLPDADIDVILEHIKRLSAVLTENADVIASFEAGFLGEFGEWHCSVNSADGVPKNGDPIVTADKISVIEAEREYLPPRTIAMRYPADIAELAASASLAGIGSHQDCYASSADDKGTWSADMQSEIEAIGVLGQTASVNATVCTSYPARVNCATALQTDQFGLAEMPTMHFSLLAADLNPNATTWMEPYRTEGCWDEIRASLGYRFVLRYADLPATVTPGTSAHLDIALSNVGFAAPYNPRPVYVVLQGPGDPVVLPLPVDARSWQPGEIALDADVAIPAELAPGDYELALWLPDPSEKLAADPAYAVRIASQGTWNADSGMNVLAQVVVDGGTDTGTGARLAATGVAGPASGAWEVALLAASAALATGTVIAVRRRGAPRGVSSRRGAR